MCNVFGTHVGLPFVAYHNSPAPNGLQVPDGLVVRTLVFWVRFPHERIQGKQVHPVLEYRVPLAVLQIPDGLEVQSCTSHPGA